MFIEERSTFRARKKNRGIERKGYSPLFQENSEINELFRIFRSSERVNLKSTIGRPTSFEKNRQIQEAAAKLGIEEYWIGATNVDNDWEWLDGSMMTYSNFDVAAGYPKKTESQVGAVSMESLFGLWYTKIDAMALPFVCEFQATEDYSQGTALTEELNSNSKAKRERDESETLRTKITNIQRG
ncbi:unnamed protein product [Caenorhabditis sp. 36 PRJEB53466]|nr:unnamed protein product [Caenorhabditis sp. 36 PRJEB53466]